MADPRLLALARLESESKIPPFSSETPYGLGRLVAETLGENPDPTKTFDNIRLLHEAQAERARNLQEAEKERSAKRLEEIAAICERLLIPAKKLVGWKSPSGTTIELDGEYKWNSKEYYVRTEYVGFSKESIAAWEKPHCPREGCKVSLREAAEDLLKPLAEENCGGSPIELFKALLRQPPIQILLSCGCIARDQCDFFRFGCHTVALTLVAR